MKKKLKVKYKTIAKNFKHYVGGGSTSYLPIFSEDFIGYSQTRGFNLLNIKTKKNNYYSIVGDTNYGIMGNEVIDAEKKIFLFDILSYKPKSNGVIRIMELNQDKGVLLGEKESTGIYLGSSNKTLFFEDENTLKATDINFNEIDHPFTKTYNKEKNNDRLKEVTDFAIHPNLPFAVCNDYKRQEMWVISWREDDIKNGKPLIQKILKNESFSYKFSYDGKWMIFKNCTPNPYEFIIMPVDPNLPYFLGKPIYLGDIPEFPSGKGVTAMTRNPSGFVASESTYIGLEDVNYLKKWDFTEAEKLIEK